MRMDGLLIAAPDRIAREFFTVSAARSRWKKVIAATVAAIASGLVTGSEQVAPTQTKAALPGAAASLACAGWDGGKSTALIARNTIRPTNGSFSAACVKGSASLPVTTISAPRSRKSSALSSATWLNRLRSAADRMLSISRSAFSRQLIVAGQHRQPHQILRRHRVGIGRGVVGGGMRPQQQVVGVVGRQIIAAGVGIGVMRIERMLPFQGLIEIIALTCRFVKRQGGADHRGEIGRQTGKQ